MYQDYSYEVALAKRKHERAAARKRKHVAIALTVALVGVLLVGGTIAYLTDVTAPVVNTFTAGNGGLTITEDIKSEPGVKKNVTITNTGNVDAYIRAQIVANWIDKDGNVYATPPEESDYDLVIGDGWQRDEVGHYYYKGIVKQNETTSDLIESCKLKDGITAPEGYYLSINILAQSIQADENAAADAWDLQLQNDGWYLLTTETN